MSRIDRTSHLADLLRTQFNRGAQKPALKGATQKVASQKADITSAGRKSSDSHSDNKHAGNIDADPIEHFIVQRVARLSQDDPERRRKAMRIFLESVLLQEFGIGLVEDTGFQTLVDQVFAQMNADTSLHAAMQEAADALLAQSGDSVPPSPTKQ